MHGGVMCIWPVFPAIICCSWEKDSAQHCDIVGMLLLMRQH